MSNILNQVIADSKTKQSKAGSPSRAWDVLILLIAVPLLCYTGFASWSFLSQNTHDTTGMIAFVGLFALDVGFLIWALVTAHHMATVWQGLVSVGLAVLAFIGIAITVGLEYAGVYLPEAAKPIASLCVIGITLVEMLGGVIYYLVSPHTLLSIQHRAAQVRLDTQRREAEHLQLMEAQEVEQMQKIVAQRGQLIELKRAAAQQLIELGRSDDGIEQMMQERHVAPGQGSRTTVQTPSPLHPIEAHTNGNGNHSDPKA